MMKKFLVSLIIGLLFSASTNSFALQCNDLNGKWKGSIGKASSFILTIHNPSAVEYASVYIPQDGGYFEYGGLTGSCTKNADGTLTLSLARHNYGVSSQLTANMANANRLDITSYYVYSTFDNYSGTGTLIK